MCQSSPRLRSCHRQLYTLSGKSIVERHNHMTLIDKNKKLNIGAKKYSLVYYLKPELKIAGADF